MDFGKLIQNSILLLGGLLVVYLAFKNVGIFAAALVLLIVMALIWWGTKKIAYSSTIQSI